MWDLKYRPYDFKDVIGHESAVATLKGLTSKPEGSSGSYLISGPRGTGKTSLARIFARVINCQRPGTCTREAPCDSCEAMLEDSHWDIEEKNSGDIREIDGMRELIAKNQFYPNSKYRVFILDEAHRLTDAAQECLLKPLEEPSTTTVWILCTTNPEKLNKTITSRCYKVPLSLLTDNEVSSVLTRTAAAENLQLPEDVKAAIVTTSEGHARDALKYLESYALAAANGGHLELQNFAKKLQTQNPKILVLKYVVGLIMNVPDQAFTNSAFSESKKDFLYDVITLLRAIVYKTVGAEALVKGNKFADKVLGNNNLKVEDASKYVRALEIHLEALGDVNAYKLTDVDALDIATAKTILAMRSL